MNKPTKREVLIREAATVDLDADAWRKRMEQWLELISTQ